MYIPIRKFVLLAMTGVVLAAGPHLGSASDVATAAQEGTGANRPAPSSCPAEVLAILAKAFNQASVTDATVSDRQEPSNGSMSDQPYPMILGD